MKNILVFFPFTSPWIIRYHLGEVKTVLDVGCGDGSLMLKVNGDKKYDVTGIDLYTPYLKLAKESGVYRKVVRSDIRKIKFRDRSFDVVLASQIIEHLNKKDGLNLIKKLEKISKYKVILTTPKGFVKYDPFEVIDDNKLQEHKSGWEIEELKNLGYKVFGQGSGLIYSPNGLLYKFRNLKDILVIISYFLSPISYFFPKTSASLTAVKK